MIQASEWTGLTTRKSSSAFNANADQSKVTCWNCDSIGHSVNSCPKPKNAKHIDAMKQKFRDAKQQRTGKSFTKAPGMPSKAGIDSMPTKGKWARPTDAECAGKTFKRVIDGKPYYLDRMFKWLPDRLAHLAIDSATLATPPPPSVGGAPAAVPVSPLSSGTPSTYDDAAKRVAVANAQRLMTQAFTALTKSFE
jgi:hypothetical protein